MAEKNGNGEKLKSPLYSNGTSEMDRSGPTMESVAPPKGGKTPPNPLGYQTGTKSGGD